MRDSARRLGESSPRKPCLSTVWEMKEMQGALNTGLGVECGESKGDLGFGRQF